HMGVQVHFSPHVAAFFRGINMTVQFAVKKPTSAAELYALYTKQYNHCDYVQVTEQIPNLQNVVNTPLCEVGGIHVSADGKRATVISCLDNLAKGAASQAMQNINKAFGMPAHLGIDNLYKTKRG
ncbi:MAG: N-acetyl-gamma-glutamyl-phosphate reductase, partial [Gammaproteobacteria bacterium]|nr:N-acetyl-gamma-glutamyl-phosphate reductase [Gammaproteobacteria bacterium]